MPPTDLQALQQSGGFTKATAVSFQYTGSNELIARVLELDKKIRRKILYKVGTEVTKIQLAEMKKQVLPMMRRSAQLAAAWRALGRTSAVGSTGALLASLGRKVSLRPPYTKVVGLVGPRRGKTSKGVLQRRLYAVTREAQAGLVPVLNRQGKQLYRQPTRYAHLAGPGRKSVFVQRTVLATAGPVKQKMVEVLSDALSTTQ